MLFPIRQSWGFDEFPVLMVDANGNPVLGIGSPDVLKLSKDSGVFNNFNDGTWTELAYGWYNVLFGSTDSNTLGQVRVHIEEPGSNHFDGIGWVLPTSTYDALYMNGAGGAGGLPLVNANNYIAGIQGTINTLDALLTTDIDSTGGDPTTILKAIETVLAAAIGKTIISIVDSDTKRVQFLGRDGVTVIATVDVSSITSGSREVSTIV